MAIRTWTEAKDAALIGLISLNMGVLLWAVKTNMRLDKEAAVMAVVVQSNIIRIDKVEEKNDKKNEQQDKRLSRLEAVLPQQPRPTKQTTFETEE